VAGAVVTPGFAQPRSELPWLPYGEQDRVIINAHNFQSAETFAVNGKDPIAVWCPSRDTAGNGTTTLSDLVGSFPMTLTNMDAATDWVADTGAGGIRAIDTDGSNDYCLNSTELTIFTTGVWSFSAWIYRRGGDYFLTFSANSFAQYIGCLINGTTVQFNLVGAAQGGLVVQAGTISNTTWTHITAVMTASGFSVYVNGSLGALTVVSGTNNQKTWSSGQLNRNAIGAFVGSSPIAWFNGRHDDYRVFSVALDAADVNYLYNSGNGRGRVA
jgi:hypothetical protein